jgi:monoamine oxidase
VETAADAVVVGAGLAGLTAARDLIAGPAWCGYMDGAVRSGERAAAEIAAALA